MVNPISHNNKLKKGLYLIPTPIGNLGDITLRAIELLKNSDFILCEDTRVSKKLLDKFEIKAKLISYHKFNEVKHLSKIINLLKENKIISLISDAGTPSISDPGAILINECLRQNIDIVPPLLLHYKPAPPQIEESNLGQLNVAERDTRDLLGPLPLCY